MDTKNSIPNENEETLNEELAAEEELDITEDVISEDEAEKVVLLQDEVLESYCENMGKRPDDEWLTQILKSHLPERPDIEITEMSTEIIDALKTTESCKIELNEAMKAGRSADSWLAARLKTATSHMSTQESANYLRGLDDAVARANESMYDTIMTKAGVPNQNMNLDGFIAEQHHVNTFNMNAAAKGDGLHAEVLKPKPGEVYAPNSVDVVIKDSSGKIVSRYQLKYGATAEDTIRMIKAGDYRGQQIVVPAEQVEAVQKAFPNKKVSATIGDGTTTSNPLSKEEAKEMQKKAQKGDFLSTDWSEYSTKDIAIGIGRQAGFCVLMGAAIGAGTKIVSKLWKGEKIKAKEVVGSAFKSGADFGVKAAAAGALKLASEKGLISVLPKGTPAATFANIAFVAVENVKIAAKVASGDLTVKEGLAAMGETTVACIGGIVVSVKGAALGATIGTVFGPVGTVVGSLVGRTVGYMAGAKIGQMVVKGVKKIKNAVVPVIKEGIQRVKEGVRSTVKQFFGKLKGKLQAALA